MNNLGVPAEDHIYTGPWINWSRGRIFGSTITLTERDGSFLVAFIALFVAFAGTSLFRIVCFFVYLRLSSLAQKDAIHHQRQAILRNSESGTTALWALTKMLWSWKRKGDSNRPLRRLSPLVALVTIITLALMLAGVLSSEISATSGDEVLISSPNCGTLSAKINDTLESILTTFASYEKRRAMSFKSYAQDCYTGSDTRNCNRLVRTRLQSTTETNVSCPFDQKICKTEANIRIDSGYLDTHNDLGINAPSNKRAQFRHVLQCAPLKNEGYSEKFDLPMPDNSTMPYVRYYYGPSEPGPSNISNATYLYPNTALYRVYAEGNINGDYTLVNKRWSPSAANQSTHVISFEPIEELRRNNNDSDIMLVFLSPNTIFYTSEVDDPWYSAHFQLGQWKLDDQTVKGYLADDPVSALGCTLRFQTCLPAKDGRKRCSELTSLSSGVTEISGMTPDEATLLRAISDYVFKFPLWQFMVSLGQESLTSRYTLGRGFQSLVSNAQWQLDVQSWFEMSLAAFQMTVVDAATGPSDPALLQFRNTPNTTAEQYFCKNQKIRSSAHANFSVFGLGLTFGLGGVIILIHWSLEAVYKKWLWRLCRSKGYATIEWNTNGVLQLQRLAHEGVGSGTWKCCDDGTPLTEGHSSLLASLDISDKSHPVLDNKVGMSPGFLGDQTPTGSSLSARQTRRSHSRPISTVLESLKSS